jgi:hypothetical protein
MSLTTQRCEELLRDRNQERLLREFLSGFEANKRPRASLSKRIVFENKDHSDIGSLMDWKLPWRHEPAGGAAFLATCANRALLGPVGHRASLDLLCALSWVVRGRRLSGGKQAFPGWACRPGIRPKPKFPTDCRAGAAEANRTSISPRSSVPGRTARLELAGTTEARSRVDGPGVNGDSPR